MKIFYGLIALFFLILAAYLYAGDIEPADTMPDQALINRMMILGVSDSTIAYCMELRKKAFIIDGKPQDGEYFYLGPQRRKGWIVKVEGGCVENIREVFNLDKKAKK